MRVLKKTILIILCFTITINFTGCFSYVDINKVLFITTLIVDIDNDNQVVLYEEAFKPTSEVGKENQGGQRLVFVGKGKTVFEAIRNINLSTSNKTNFTQNRVIIFTQRAAEYGLDNFVDFFERDQELIMRAQIAIYAGDPNKLINVDLKEEKFIGVYIMQLINNVKVSSRALELNLNDFYNQRLIGDKTNVITMISIPKEGGEDKIQIDGGAVVSKDKMISKITKTEGQGFNFFMNTVQSGTLEITNPICQEKFVTLEILSSKTKTKIEYIDGIVYLKKAINVNANFAATEKDIIFDETNIKKIKEKAESNIEESCLAIFQKYKDMGVDIFDIQELFYVKYPHINIRNIINSTTLELDVNVDINNTGDTYDFR